MTFFVNFARSQWSALPYPTTKFTGQTIIVTGANSGLGLEAARHFVRLDAAKVILAVRTLSKGQEAAESIAQSTKRQGVVEVWELDLERYSSVKAFASRANGLDRLDIIVANAGMYAVEFSTAEGDETTITVNVISTLLLGILLLPKLRETSSKFSKSCILTFTGSFVHYLTDFPERNNEKIFDYLAKKENARMIDRYNVSKMMELLLVRELAAQVQRPESSHGNGHVTISIVNPGFVATSITKNTGLLFQMYTAVLKSILSRSPEVGARTLLHAAGGDEQTHGKYLDDCKIGKFSPFVESEEGLQTQKKLWEELSEKLEHVAPGAMQNI